ncbi:hypothetical protein [Curtobacterium flaccumfaciens]|uniref:hypothetical protein n=1 Tax=Curtobacterium flaccumfaciens TaxID=2035 RepID=UPI0038794023
MLNTLRNIGDTLWRVTRRLPFEIGLLIVAALTLGKEQIGHLATLLVAVIAIELVVRALLGVFAPILSKLISATGDRFTSFTLTYPRAAAAVYAVLFLAGTVLTHQPLALTIFGAVYVVAFVVLRAHFKGSDVLSRRRRAGRAQETAEARQVKLGLARVAANFYAPEQGYKRDDGSVDEAARHAEVERHITQFEEHVGGKYVVTLRNDVPGKTDEDLVKALASVPSVLAAKEWELHEPEEPTPGFIEFEVWMRERPDATKVTTYRSAEVDQTITIERVPIGLTRDGDVQCFNLNGVHTFIGGTTGAGKSALATNIRIGVAKQRNAAMFGADPKLLEMNRWKPRYTAVVGEPCCISALLEALNAEMDRRKKQVEALGLTSVPQSMWDQLPLIYADIDEAADVFVSPLGDKQSKRNKFLVDRLTAQARALGIVLMLATQRPDATLFSKATMANIPQAIALRVTNRPTAVMILREEDVVSRNPAHKIPQGKRYAGVGYAITETATRGTKVRGFYVPIQADIDQMRIDRETATDEQLALLTARTVDQYIEETAHLRTPAPLIEWELNEHYAVAHPDLHDASMESPWVEQPLNIAELQTY